MDLAVATAKEQLKSFANDEKFLDKMNLAFGDGWQTQEAYALLQDLANGEAMPKIEILPAANLNTNGAFGKGTIYLSENFLSENITSSKVVSSVLLEEVGHYLDRELNSVDSAGDEGNIFAKLVQGETITGTELKALKTEDDSAFISLNGENIAVELAEKQGNIGFFTFDAKYYLDANPDLENVFGNNSAAAEQHWLDYGKKEGRSSSPVFDVKYYLNKNSDLKNIFGDNYAAAEQHWLDYGKKEGRSSSPDFDVKYYLDKNPDLKKVFGDNYDAAVQHWLDYGINEGRIGSADTALPYPGYLLKYEPESTLTYDENVKDWQQRMKDLGKDIDVDGLYGPQSAKVAREFQQEKGLAVDGIVGPDTWEASFDTENNTPSSPLPEGVSPDSRYPNYSGKITVNSDLSSNMRAFLDMIAHAEGTNSPDGYRIIFGGEKFTEFADHPNKTVTAGGYTSTAAGRYQFLNQTWEETQSNLGLPDFSPKSQDLAAVQQIKNKDAFDDVEAGKFEEAVRAVRKVWASLPGAGYGQPEKSLAELKEFYEKSLQNYA